jgi:hypothetical protein
MKQSKKSLLLIAALMLVPLFASAQSAKCVQREDQISDSPNIKNFVGRLGGIDNLQGDWRLGGMAGQFKRVVISFESASDGMKAQVIGLDGSTSEPAWGPISVCDTVRSDTLQVKVLTTKDSLYMRLGNAGSLQLAQIADGKVGSFYTFNKQ